MKNSIGVKYTYLIIVITLFAILSAIIINAPVFWGLLIGLISAFVILHISGYSYKELLNMVFKGMRSALIVIIMLSMIGILIGIWMYSGTIPGMVYYGFKYLSNTNIIFSAFITCSIISMTLGTALGTISIVGSVFLSLALGLDVPIAPLVGAVVSGAYLGDRTSPMSSSANLTAIMTETNIISNIIHMWYTTIPAYIISSASYWIIGNKYIASIQELDKIKYIQDTLSNSFNINFLVFLSPLVILITAVILRASIVKSISLGLVISLLILVLQDTTSINTILSVAIKGYYPANIEIRNIIFGGGFLSMKNVLLVIIFSTGLNGILEGTGMIAPILKKFSQEIKSTKNLIHKTSILSILIATITCNQTLAAIIPGQYLKDLYKKFSLSKNTLARTISDTALVSVPLIPWNVNAITISSIMGISAIEYIPYAIFCYLLIIITFVYPYITKGYTNSKTISF